MFKLLKLTIAILGSLFIISSITAFYFAMKADNYKKQNKNILQEISFATKKLNKIEKSMKSLDIYSDMIDDLVMKTLEDKTGSNSDITHNLIEGFDKGASQYEDTSDFSPSSIANKLADIDASSERLERTVGGFVNIMKHRKNILTSMPSITPTGGWITSPFGIRISPFTHSKVMHKGLDIGNRIGNPVYATAAGKVLYAGYSQSFGYIVIIKHAFGVITRYAHNSKIMVKKGQLVKRGDLIALVGNTGRSTGPHVHYEVWVNNKVVNPADYLLDRELEHFTLLVNQPDPYKAIGGEEFELSTKDLNSKYSDLKNNKAAGLNISSSLHRIKRRSDINWKKVFGFILISLGLAVGIITIIIIQKNKPLNLAND